MTPQFDRASMKFLCHSSITNMRHNIPERLRRPRTCSSMTVLTASGLK